MFLSLDKDIVALGVTKNLHPFANLIYLDAEEINGCRGHFLSESLVLARFTGRSSGCHRTYTPNRLCLVLSDVASC